MLINCKGSVCGQPGSGSTFLVLDKCVDQLLVHVGSTKAWEKCANTL